MALPSPSPLRGVGDEAVRLEGIPAGEGGAANAPSGGAAGATGALREGHIPDPASGELGGTGSTSVGLHGFNSEHGRDEDRVPETRGRRSRSGATVVPSASPLSERTKSKEKKRTGRKSRERRRRRRSPSSTPTRGGKKGKNSSPSASPRGRSKRRARSRRSQRTPAGTRDTVGQGEKSRVAGALQEVGSKEPPPDDRGRV